MKLAEVPRVEITRSDAKSSGILHYFTGKPCAHGHVAVRWVRNGECSACSQARRADPVKSKKSRERARVVYSERKELMNERQRQARQRNPEGYRKRQAAYCQKNPEKRKNSQNQYYARNRGRYLEYNRSREQGSKKATPPWADKKAIEAVYQRAKHLEDETGVEYHVDHHIPLKGVNERGEHVVCGLHVHYNLTPIPARENRAKTNKFEVV